MTSEVRPKFPRLYAIVDAETCVRRGVQPAQMARALCDAGVRLLQYRDKINGPHEILRVANSIAEEFAGSEATLIMNDRADLAALLGWGVHVGQGDLDIDDARRVAQGISERHAIIGISTHNASQLRMAADSNADYIAVGPVFATATKRDAEPAAGLELVRLARALTPKPVVAIGGITLSNARSVLDAGADSVAVISGLFVDGLAADELAGRFLEL